MMHPSFRVLQIFVRDYGWTAGVFLLRGHLHWQEHYLCALLDCTWCRCAFECLLGGSFALIRALFVCIVLHNAHAFTRASFLCIAVHNAHLHYIYTGILYLCLFVLIYTGTGVLVCVCACLYVCACAHYIYTLGQVCSPTSEVISQMCARTQNLTRGQYPKPPLALFSMRGYYCGGQFDPLFSW